MRALIGFLLLALVINGIASAERAVVECAPVIKPEPERCGLALTLKLGYTPNRCRDA
jgi:hypothetical protein